MTKDRHQQRTKKITNTNDLRFYGHTIVGADKGQRTHTHANAQSVRQWDSRGG